MLEINCKSDPAIDQVRVRVLPDGRMSRRDAAKYLGFTEKTMAMRACQGKRPNGVKVGGRVFYYKAELDDFVREGE